VTVALIVIGVVLFIALDVFILTKVLSRHRSQDDYGSIAVPGSTTVTVDAPGKLRLSYEEAVKAPTVDGDIQFDPPAALQVRVVNDARGEELEITGPGFRGMGSSVSGTGSWTRAVVGTAEITEPGSYTVTAGPELDGAVQPKILVGR
jgi:hypothetical protein